MSEKIPIVLFHEWISGLGEQTQAVNGFLRIADFINEEYPNKFYIIYNVWVYGWDGAGSNKNGIEKILNVDYLKNFVDEVNILDRFNGTNLTVFTEQSEFTPIKYALGRPFGQRVPLSDAIFMKRDSFDEGIAKHIGDFVTNKLACHPLMIQNIQMQLPTTDTININPKEFMSDTVKKIADTFCSNNNLKKFKTIFFRLHQPTHSVSYKQFRWWPEHEELDIAKSVFNRIIAQLDKNTTYFLSSNSDILKHLFKEHNVSFVDRDIFSIHLRDSLLSGEIPRTQLPAVIPAGLFDIEECPQVISEFLAAIEMEIMSRSEEIIHFPDCGFYNDMISLFLWYPLIVKKLPLRWITCQDQIPAYIKFNDFGIEINEAVPFEIK